MNFFLVIVAVALAGVDCRRRIRINPNAGYHQDYQQAPAVPEPSRITTLPPPPPDYQEEFARIPAAQPQQRRQRYQQAEPQYPAPTTYRPAVRPVLQSRSRTFAATEAPIAEPAPVHAGQVNRANYLGKPVSDYEKMQAANAKPAVRPVLQSRSRTFAATEAPIAEPAPVYAGQVNRANYLGKPVSDYEKMQAANAKYSFSSDIDDKISDLTNSRKEVRDGLKVMGSYSYSDGYYKRTVHYVADENGYRVTGEEAIPLDVPHVDLMGTASVDSDAHGHHIAYRIQSVPVPGPVPHIVTDAEDA